MAHMLSHVGDILTATGKHGDGKLTPAQASEILQSESEDKGYLAYLEKAADEVSSGVYAMEAMRGISAKVMSLSTYTASQHTMEVAVHATALQSYHGQHADKAYQRTMQVAVNATSLHTCHGQRAVICDDKYKEPPGFEVRHLNLNETEVQEMVRVYENEISTFHKVDLKSVYAVATGHDKDMLPLLTGQISPWIGKQIFPVAPPGSKYPLLYTPASAAIKRWGDPAVLEAGERMNRVLVPLMQATHGSR